MDGKYDCGCSELRERLAIVEVRHENMQAVIADMAAAIKENTLELKNFNSKIDKRIGAEGIVKDFSKYVVHGAWGTITAIVYYITKRHIEN